MEMFLLSLLKKKATAQAHASADRDTQETSNREFIKPGPAFCSLRDIGR